MQKKAKCENCGKNYNSDEEKYSNICPNCKRRRGSKLYFKIALGIIVISFISGIVTGNINKSVKTSYNEFTEKYDKEESFNVNLMYDYWLKGSILGLLSFGFGSINCRLDIIIDNNSKS